MVNQRGELTLSDNRRAKMNKWYVYIAEARTGRYYVGITQNVKRRIERHNNKLGSRFAINQGPFKLAYQSKAFDDKSEARKREVQIKKWTKVKKEKLIKGEWT